MITLEQKGQAFDALVRLLGSGSLSTAIIVEQGPTGRVEIRSIRHNCIWLTQGMLGANVRLAVDDRFPCIFRAFKSTTDEGLCEALDEVPMPQTFQVSASVTANIFTDATGQKWEFRRIED